MFIKKSSVYRIIFVASFFFQKKSLCIILVGHDCSWKGVPADPQYISYDKKQIWGQTHGPKISTRSRGSPISRGRWGRQPFRFQEWKPKSTILDLYRILFWCKIAAFLTIESVSLLPNLIKTPNFCTGAERDEIETPRATAQRSRKRGCVCRRNKRSTPEYCFKIVTLYGFPIKIFVWKSLHVELFECPRNQTSILVSMSA